MREGERASERAQSIKLFLSEGEKSEEKKPKTDNRKLSRELHNPLLGNLSYETDLVSEAWWQMSVTEHREAEKAGQ